VSKEDQIGQKIKGLRLFGNITLTKIAGFTESYLSKVERSVKAPLVSILIIKFNVLKNSV